jgi:hypothetical protein
MESKSLIFGIVGLVIAGGGAIVVSSFQLESLKADVRRKQVEVTAARQAIHQAKDTLERNTSKLELLRTSAGRIVTAERATEGLTADLAKHTKMLESAKAKWDINVQMMQEAVEQARLAFRNTVTAELPLKNGETLKDCKFVGIKDGNALFQHNTGTARLTAAQLPPPIADRLRLETVLTLDLPPDPDTITPLPQIAKGGPLPLPVGSSTGATPEEELPPPAPAAVTPPPGMTNDARFAIKTTINNLRTQIANAETQRAAFLQAAREADTKFRSARIQGRSSSQSVIRDKANASAATLQSQIDAANAQIRKLELDLSAP